MVPCCLPPSLRRKIVPTPLKLSVVLSPATLLTPYCKQPLFWTSYEQLLGYLSSRPAPTSTIRKLFYLKDTKKEKKDIKVPVCKQINSECLYQTKPQFRSQAAKPWLWPLKLVLRYFRRSLRLICIPTMHCKQFNSFRV